MNMFVFFNDDEEIFNFFEPSSTSIVLTNFDFSEAKAVRKSSLFVIGFSTLAKVEIERGVSDSIGVGVQP